MAIARPDTQLLDALSAPIGDLIAEVGRGVAEAQQAMDAATIEQVRALAEGDDSTLALLRQIGWQPTWYQIPEASAEITVALTLTGSGQSPGGGNTPRMQLVATPVDASYANRYAYELKAASSVKFRIVPVPPSPAFEAVRAVPKVVGLTYATARARLAEQQLGWQWPQGTDEPADQTPVVVQTPAPGEFARVGDVIVLGF
ncbi:MAG: PASTA domain-containing protein [Myxococcales bacterium]|nr:PASTA domain-containing protein [Myxococcales bacterium]MCB9541312.1 PASTA domain-containing protein [Myxococcales bacterium]MCB9553592.1 PASTA domain-containing protein [Myxococcales bacterium]